MTAFSMLVQAEGGDCSVTEAATSTFGRIENREAVIPAQCYTRTDEVSNPCWSCHTERNGRNDVHDWALQAEYAFSDAGLTNHWENLFVDRRAEMKRLSDRKVLNYIREDNYTPFRQRLNSCTDYRGWRPDLDLSQGFDDEGFARDGSWWRAFRYKPFLGTFWPTNGSTDDAFIRLPWQFRTLPDGTPSGDVYKTNLAIVEAAVTVPDSVPDAQVRRRIEPVNEQATGMDLNGDGKLTIATEIRGLPSRYAGAASRIAVQRFLYPAGTEFLHTVRYIDPDRPHLLSERIKEVRYSIKQVWANDVALAFAYMEEKDKKERGVLPMFRGAADLGLINDFGWRLQGFIEDAQGRLRAQTHEETQYCMGCHGNIGVTVDQTFGFPRKLPGREGWGHQTLHGMQDVPQAGHAEPEILTYFRRVGGGDEFRANTELLGRFFPGGQLDEAQVRRAAPGGERDLAWLLTPSRTRALDLNRAYMLVVREQSYSLGRDVVVEPTRNVHPSIQNGATGFDESSGIYRDGRLWLDWQDEEKAVRK